jgi:hypothetical protein
MVDVILFDYKEFDEVPYLKSSVEDLVEENRNDKSVCFISSANSLLFMDGGSDLGYMKAIPNIERLAKTNLKQLELISNCGRPYLPIGCSQMITPSGTYKFISSPSMFLPQKVGNTRNPYNTLKTALNLVYKYNLQCRDKNELIRTVYTPFICTNWGGFTFQESYDMMQQAINDYKNDDYNFIKKSDSLFFNIHKNYNSITQEQPKVYMNTEFGITINQVLSEMKKKN